MSKFDTMHRCLKIKPEIRLPILPEFVAAVFGLPSSGAEVWDSSLNKSKVAFDRIGETISYASEDDPPSEAAYRVLESIVCGDSVQQAGPIRFITSFLVCLITILVDSDSPGCRETTSFWPALASGRDLKSFNWASFFL
jgi:hypothetical protein